MTLSIIMKNVALSMMADHCYPQCCYAEYRLLFIVMLNVIMLSITFYFIVMLNFVMLSVTFYLLLYWVLFFIFIYWFTEFHFLFIYCYAECRYAECCFLFFIMLCVAFYLLLCRMTLCLVSLFIYCYAECRYAECHNAKCRGADWATQKIAW
jgi:hypothetical protein